MMENCPKVSVIIPTYKRPDKLDRAIKSILVQTYQNVEVIVVDDNDPNTEGRCLTENLMLAYADCSKVRYVKHPYNKNGSAARNTGAAACNADYISFLDDDDEFLPTKIESQIRRLEELDNTYGCCYSKYATRKDGGKLVVGQEHREGYLYVEALCRELCTMAGSNLLIKRGAFESIGGFDESFKRHQDVEFLTKLLQKYKIAYDNNLGLIVNVHKQNDKVDYQKILDQYEEAFLPTVNLLGNDVKKRFYYNINIQRFWDFLRTKHDIHGAINMIAGKKITVLEAIRYSAVQTINFIRRKM